MAVSRWRTSKWGTSKRLSCVGLGCVGPALLAMLAACSGDSSGSGSVTAGATNAATSAPTTIPTTAVPTTVPVTPRVIVSVVAKGIDSSIGIDVDASTTTDPFATFASCSGLRDVIGVYSVLVSDPSSPLGMVSILSAESVSGPGSVAAVARFSHRADIEGTLTLDEGLQSGSFVSDGAARPVRLEFECVGRPEPQVLDKTESEIEIIALLQRGADQRLITFAAPVSLANADCSADGISIDLDTTDGDRYGSISAFAASGQHLEVGIGDTTQIYDMASVSSLNPEAGTFTAKALNGMVIDGAYRCT